MKYKGEYLPKANNNKKKVINKYLFKITFPFKNICKINDVIKIVKKGIPR